MRKAGSDTQVPGPAFRPPVHFVSLARRRRPARLAVPVAAPPALVRATHVRPGGASDASADPRALSSQDTRPASPRHMKGEGRCCRLGSSGICARLSLVEDPRYPPGLVLASRFCSLLPLRLPLLVLHQSCTLSLSRMTLQAPSPWRPTFRLARCAHCPCRLPCLAHALTLLLAAIAMQSHHISARLRHRDQPQSAHHPPSPPRPLPRRSSPLSPRSPCRPRPPLRQQRTTRPTRRAPPPAVSRAARARRATTTTTTRNVPPSSPVARRERSRP